MTNPLLELGVAGQAVWLDYLHRKIIEDGELHQLIAQDGVAGLTSNPSIFEQAIGSGDAYDAALADLIEHGDEEIMGLYEQLAIADIRGAADLFRPRENARDDFACGVRRHCLRRADEVGRVIGGLNGATDCKMGLDRHCLIGNDRGRPIFVGEAKPSARAIHRENGKIIDNDDVVIVSLLDLLTRSTRDVLDILDTLATRGAVFRSLGGDWAETTTAHGRGGFRIFSPALWPLPSRLRAPVNPRQRLSIHACRQRCRQRSQVGRHRAQQPLRPDRK